MIAPILNRNGSSVTDLTEPRLAARDALLTAIDAVMKAAPHGRDYPGDALGFAADRVTHFDRIGTLNRLASELMIEAIAIKNQQEGK
jgi:hypothetical protein